MSPEQLLEQKIFTGSPFRKKSLSGNVLSAVTRKRNGVDVPTSLSKMVTIDVPLPPMFSPPVVLVIPMVKSSFPSTDESSSIGIWMLFDRSPSLNVTVLCTCV